MPWQGGGSPPCLRRFSARAKLASNLARISSLSFLVSPCLAWASHDWKLCMIFSREISPAAYCLSQSRMRRFIRLMEE